MKYFNKIFIYLDRKYFSYSEINIALCFNRKQSKLSFLLYSYKIGIESELFFNNSIV